jgi:hypothetical protein
MMLWDAGQERTVRERRERLTELFVAARDAALDVLVSTGRAKPVGTWRLPPYARAQSSQPVRSPAARDATLAKLGVMFPGIVQQGAVS